MDKIDLNEDIEEIDKKLEITLLEAAKQSISKSKGRMKRKAVPWWTDECSKIVKERNRALRLLRRTHNVQNLIRYKQEQARVRKIIREAKRQNWQTICNKTGRLTPVGEYVVVEVWVEKKELVVVNYYNPCMRIELNKLEGIEGKVIICR